MRLLAVALLAALPLAACGGSDTPPAVPGLSIVSPAAGSTVTLGTDADKSVDVTFALENFRLSAPGTCAADTACGHVHVFIDGPACNVAPYPYNNFAASGTVAKALFGKCTAPTGNHIVRLELHDDDHREITVGGTVVSASVQLTTK